MTAQWLLAVVGFTVSMISVYRLAIIRDRAESAKRARAAARQAGARNVFARPTEWGSVEVPYHVIQRMQLAIYADQIEALSDDTPCRVNSWDMALAPRVIGEGIRETALFWLYHIRTSGEMLSA